jgi:RHS repeat-associated protein
MYDAWGVKIPLFNPDRQKGSPEHRNKYNGKEYLSDLGWYEYGARMYDPTIGEFSTVDPLANKREWLTPYNFLSNNPINRIDPDGALDMAVPFDWVQLQDRSVKYDAAINKQSQATAKYGAGTVNLGRSAVLSNGNSTVYLSSDGIASNAVPLGEVSVTANSTNNMLDEVNDAFGLSNDAHSGVLAGVQMLDGASEGFQAVGKALDVVGKFSGVTGAAVSIKQAYENPSAGNITRAVLDIGLVGVKSTTVGLIDGVLSVTGVKDAAFNAIDSQIDKYQLQRARESQSINPSTINQ